MVDAPPTHVVIVGGGIAGLAAARRVITNDPAARVTLLEADTRLGGKIRTESVTTDRGKTFLIECGPDSFLTAKPRGMGLCADLGMLDALQGITPQPHRAYVAWGGSLHELPEGLTGLVPTRLSPVLQSSLLSPIGKARLALDGILPAKPGTEDETVGSFVRRRLGDQAWERLVEPLMAGIYAANGDLLSLQATFPQLREAEIRHGGLAKGVLANRATATPATRPAFMTPATGLESLVTTLRDHLVAAGATIRLGTPAITVLPPDDLIGPTVLLPDNEPLVADAVIIATPAFVAADILGDSSPMIAADLAGIEHASSAIVTLAYPKPRAGRARDAHGYLIPRALGSPILACTWSSLKWQGRAPEDHLLMRVFLGRYGNDDVLRNDDPALVDLAVAEVQQRIGVVGQPVLSRVDRWERGMPQYLLGHPERIARIDAAVAERPWLALAGMAYRGVGIPDAILSGESAADRVRPARTAPSRIGASA